MINLGTYIVKLLNENQQVYLPALGLFKTERVPSTFDKNTNTFIAPTYRIIFQVTEGSAIPLIRSISEHEQWSEIESENQLKTIIQSILLELDEKGTYYFEDLGELNKEGDTISFVESELKMDIPFYKNADEIKLIESSKKEPLLESTIKKDETKEEVLPIVEFEPKGRPINWLWPAIIIAVLIAAGALWFLNPKKINQEKTSIPILQDSKSVAIPDTTISLKSEDISVAEQDSATTELSKNEEHSEEVLQKPKTTYEIIIVSFGKLSEAEKYVENMKANGYKTRILENQNPGNLYKISYSSFTDEKEAQVELNEVRETISRDAWIYKKKK